MNTSWRISSLASASGNGIQSEMPNSLNKSGMHDEISRPFAPCGGRFAEKVAGNVDKGQAPTLLPERLEVRLDENLDGLFARINLDTNRRVTKVDLVASPVFSSNDGVRHWRPAPKGSATISDHPRPRPDPKSRSNYGLERCGPLDNVGNRSEPLSIT
jgi:hypothetical protein